MSKKIIEITDVNFNQKHKVEINTEDIPMPEITPEQLLELMEGSDYISVDLNQDESKILIELDETKLDEVVTEDSDNLITSGAVFDAIHDLDASDILGTGGISIQSMIDSLNTSLSGKLDASKSAVAGVGGLVIPTPALTDEVLVMLNQDKSQKNVYLDDQVDIDESDALHIVGVQETRNSDTLKFWSGTQAQYDSISSKDSNTIYFIKEA